MGDYYNIEMGDYIFNEIIFALEEQAKCSKEISKITESIHMIDYLEDAKSNDINRQNKELDEWLKHQKMFEENKEPENPFLYSAIHECLNKTGIKEWDSESKYYLVMNLIEIFDKYKEKNMNKGVKDLL